jgi:4-azaleucine resistance transporter AzlC
LLPPPLFIEGPASFDTHTNGTPRSPLQLQQRQRVRCSNGALAPSSIEAETALAVEVQRMRISTAPIGSRRSEFFAGVRAQLPLLLGVAPFGMAYGAYAAKSGLPSAPAQAMSAIAFGGAGQFVGVRLYTNAVPAAVIVLATLLVNGRHMLYSASLAPYTDHLAARWRWLLAYLLTDEAYATAITRYRRGDVSPHAHWFFFGAGTALWVIWQATTAIGVFGGGAVPDSWSLEFALPLTFLAILIPALKSRPAAAAAIVGGAFAVIGFRWPYGTGLLTAIMVGMVAGIVADLALGQAPAIDEVEAP